MNHNEYEQAKTDAAADAAQSGTHNEVYGDTQDACTQRMGDKWAELLPQIVALYDPSIPLKSSHDATIFALIGMAYGMFKMVHDMSKELSADDPSIKGFGYTSERKNRHAFVHEMLRQIETTNRLAVQVKLSELCKAEASDA